LGAILDPAKSQEGVPKIMFLGIMLEKWWKKGVRKRDPKNNKIWSKICSKMRGFGKWKNHGLQTSLPTRMSHLCDESKKIKFRGLENATLPTRMSHLCNESKKCLENATKYW
jgi:hypothetical protein